MGDHRKKPLTGEAGDADIIIWPRLKATAKQLQYGRFTVTFEVHGGRLRMAEIKDKVERVASF